MLDCKSQELLEFIDSVITASLLNDRPEDALDSLAFYYQVDREVMEGLLIDVYYNYIMEKTDFKFKHGLGEGIDKEILLKSLIYLVVLEDSPVERLESILKLSRKDIEAVYNAICKEPRLISHIIGYIEYATRSLLGVKC